MNTTHSLDVPITVSTTVSEQPGITNLLFPNEGKIDGVGYMIICVTVTSSYEIAVTHGHIAQCLQENHYSLVGWKIASDSLRQAIRTGVATYQKKVADNVDSFYLHMYGDNQPDGWFTTFGWNETTDGECRLGHTNPATLFDKNQFILVTLPRGD